MLSHKARDLLTPPISTVASEYAFSVGGRVLEEKRSRISSDKLDFIMCLKDWKGVQYRMQEHMDDIVQDFENLDIDNKVFIF